MAPTRPAPPKSRYGRGGSHLTRERVADNLAQSNAASNINTDPSIASSSRGNGPDRGRISRSSRGGRGGHHYQGSSRNSNNKTIKEEVNYTKLSDEHFNGEARAGDVPHCENSNFKKWASQWRDCNALTQPRAGSNSHATLYGRNSTLLKDLKFQFDPASQRPMISLRIGSEKDTNYFYIPVSSLNQANPDGAILTYEIVAGKLNPSEIQKQCKEKLNFDISLLNAIELIKLVQNPNPEDGNQGGKGEANTKGLSLMSIDICSPMIFKRGSSKSPPAEVAEFRKRMDGSTRILISRDTWYPYTLLDTYFKQRALACKDGHYPFVRQNADPTIGQQFKRFWETGSEATLPHMPWMNIPPTPDKPAKNKYVSLPEIKWFDSLSDMETVMSAAVIHDRDTQKELLQSVFNRNQFHTVRSRKGLRGDLWYFHVEMIKSVEQHIPTLSPGTSLKMTQKFTPSPESVKVTNPKSSVKGKEKETAAEGDKMEVDSGEGAQQPYWPGSKHSPSTIFATHDARVVDIATSLDFVVACSIPDNSVDDWAQGHARHVVFEMTPNPIPANRQLQSIADLAALDNDHVLTGYICAKDVEKLQKRESLEALFGPNVDPTTMEAILSYDAAAQCNPEQTKVCIETFNSKYAIVMCQGPPGTGKSTVLGYIAVRAAAMGVKVSVTAPANIPSRTLALKVISEQLDYKEHLKWAKETALDIDVGFDIVFVPTRSQCGRELFDLLTLADEEENDDKVLREYSLAAHCTRYAQQKADEGDRVAQEWVQMRLNIKNASQHVSSQDKSMWRQVGLSFAPQIFKQKRVKIVISTCNNHANEVLVHWEADLNISDEAAFATMPDVFIPLAKNKNAKKHLIVGDHEQLAPIVPSSGLQEFSDPLRQSLFMYWKNALGDTVPYIMLKENYRMHPEVAEFPAAVKYGGLLCSDCTLGETRDIWKAWKDFMATDDGQAILNTRRHNQFWDQKSAGIRRLFINTGGFSSPKPGSSSMQNFGNINWIMLLLKAFVAYMKLTNCTFRKDDLVIQVPYNAQKNELVNQIKKAFDKDVVEWITVKTIDSNQGGQSAFSWIDITPADKYHGSQIGFLDSWNRPNVASTRGQDNVVIFGNFDALEKELEILWSHEKTQPWALLMMHLQLRGDILDVHTLVEKNNVDATANSKRERQDWEPNLYSKAQAVPEERKLHKGDLDVMRSVTEQSRQELNVVIHTKLLQLLAAADATVAELKRQRAAIPASEDVSMDAEEGEIQEEKSNVLHNPMQSSLFGDVPASSTGSATSAPPASMQTMQAFPQPGAPTGPAPRVHPASHNPVNGAFRHEPVKKVVPKPSR